MKREERKSIAVFGGTFDPVHKGHYYLVKKIKEVLNCDDVMIIPNGNAPHKELETDKIHRYNMVKIAFSSLDWVIVSDREVTKDTPSYTWETLRDLKENYDKIYFVMGMDNLYDIVKWKFPEKICKYATLCFFSRKGYEKSNEQKKLLEKNYNAKIKFFDFDFDISSTKIREMIENGDYVFDVLCKEVFLYILKNGLYNTKCVKEFDNFEKDVKDLVDEKRYKHSLGVAMCSYLLAKKNNEDEKKAYFTGLVHDIAKRMPYDEQKELCKKTDVSDEEMQYKKMLHAPAGSVYLKNNYNITDEKIIRAVRLHTRGSCDMTLFDKIIYICDYIEPCREYDAVDYLREKTFSDIDEGIFCSCDETIKMLVDRKERIFPCLVELRNKMLDIIVKKI